tara:strand:- start:7573 stop:7719 length:147 start_codon:yes stop_codon:yes gene_type:complete
VINYFYYKIQEREEHHREFGFEKSSELERDTYYKEIENNILIWKRKLK